MFRTIIYFNNCNGAPFSNENIQDAEHRVISEEELDAHNINVYYHNVTVDNFSQTPNAQRENENTILKSEKIDKLDVLSKTLKGLKINDAGYYESGSANANGENGDTASNPKIATHTSDRNKIKFTDTSNKVLQQNY